MKIDLPQQKHLVYEDLFSVRWGDLDAFGHVNNCSFFRYMESVRLSWMHSVGIPVAPSQQGVVVATAFCNFIKQIWFPEDLRIKMYASDIRNKSFETWYTLDRVSEPDVVLASGGATMVWIDFSAGRADTIPERLREQLRGGEAVAAGIQGATP